jgi:hypothetical protein
MKTARRNPRVGSSFEKFLREEGIANEVNARAIERVKRIQAPTKTLPARVAKRGAGKKAKTGKAG